MSDKGSSPVSAGFVFDVLVIDAKGRNAVVELIRGTVADPVPKLRIAWLKDEAGPKMCWEIELDDRPFVILNVGLSTLRSGSTRALVSAAGKTLEYAYQEGEVASDLPAWIVGDIHGEQKAPSSFQAALVPGLPKVSFTPEKK